MLEVPSRILLLIKKCSSSSMQDFYNLTRSWHITNYGRSWQNSCAAGASSQMPFDSSNNSNQSAFKRIKNRDYRDGDFEFSLMSYNVLSQDLLEQHMDLYQSCPPSALDWPSRRRKLAQELQKSNPDIICFQEVNSYHHNKFFKRFLNLHGYSGLYKKRNEPKCDGCALYYKTSKFTCLDHLEIDFYRQDLSPTLNRDNVAIIGVLKPASDSRSIPSRIIVATTHILFNPSRGEIKLAQIRLLLAEIDRLLASLSPDERKYSNVILCGDMNSQPFSPFYQFITQGKLETSGYFCGEISGQNISRGKPFRPSDLNIQGIDRSTRYIDFNTSLDLVQNSEYLKDSSYGKTNLGKKCQDDQSKFTRESFLKEEQNSQKKSQESSFTISHNFDFSSVYPSHDKYNLPFVTTLLDKGSCMVDYIFYNRSDNLKLLGYQRLLNSQQMTRVGFIPNNFLGSDHLSLHAKFLLRKRKTRVD